MFHFSMLEELQHHWLSKQRRLHCLVRVLYLSPSRDLLVAVVALYCPPTVSRQEQHLLMIARSQMQVRLGHREGAAQALL